MSTFQLQIWDGENYFLSPHESDLPDDLKTIAKRVSSRAYRIIDVSRNKPLPRKPKANFASSKRRRLDDGIPEWQQAQAAATHYLKLRRQRDDNEDNSWTDVDVPVYPVKPSGGGTASEFRSMLAGLLTDTIRSTKDCLLGNTIESRKLNEAKLAAHGFRFTEVALEDYA